jgi:tight adherence protein B
MFSNLTAILAIAALAMLSAGALAYVFLYGRIATANRAGQRLDRVQSRGPSTDTPAARAADPARRRKSVQETLKGIEEKQKAKANHSKSPPMALRIEQAGLAWSHRTFLIISIACGVFLFLITWASGAPIYAAFGFLIAGAFGLPRWIVNFLRKRRANKFIAVFADAIDVIVRGVKAGLPLNDCIKIIGAEAVEPVKSEFRKISETQSLGVPLSEAVMKLAERVPAPEANFFAIVISIQQTAGGNLAETLANLSRVLRERSMMKEKISAMSMEAKASAVIIGSLPIIVMVMVYFTSPAYLMLLFTDPLGHVILGGSAVWMLLGIMVMRKMVNFDF